MHIRIKKTSLYNINFATEIVHITYSMSTFVESFCVPKSFLGLNGKILLIFREMTMFRE